MSYILLIFISKYLDPRNRKGRTLEKWSIYRIVGFAAVKIIFASLPFLITVAFTGLSPENSLGFSGFSINIQVFLRGLITALIFFIVNVIFNQLSTHIQYLQKKCNKGIEKQIISKLPVKKIPLILTLVLISFQAGVLEEVFFRGIIQSNITQVLLPYGGVLIASFLFGLAHFYQGLRGIINTFILGLILGLSLRITGNIVVPILGHFLGDLICMIAGLPEIMKTQMGESRFYND